MLALCASWTQNASTFAKYACESERSRVDIRYIYGTFPIVERQERDRWGTFGSRDLALAWINALMAGQPDAEIDG